MPDVAATEGLRHVSFFYQSIADYRTALGRFVCAGVARREPVLLAVPQLSVVLPDLPARSSALVTVTDMAELGGNPARILAAQEAKTVGDKLTPAKDDKKAIFKH